MTILEGNKLIAEFMGAKWVEDGRTFLYKVAPTKHTSFLWNDYALEYHSSWEWLMPVVEKIEGLGFKTVASNDGFSKGHYINIITGVGIMNETVNNPSKFMGTGETKIESYYQGIVQFIQWYNQNNQQ